MHASLAEQTLGHNDATRALFQRQGCIQLQEIAVSFIGTTHCGGNQRVAQNKDQGRKTQVSFCGATSLATKKRCLFSWKNCEHRFHVHIHKLRSISAPAARLRFFLVPFLQNTTPIRARIATHSDSERPNPEPEKRGAGDFPRRNGLDNIVVKSFERQRRRGWRVPASGAPAEMGPIRGKGSAALLW